MLLYQILACNIHGKFFKNCAKSWNDKFGLSDLQYSVLDTQDYFEYIIRKTSNSD